MLAAERAELLKLETLGSRLLVLRVAVVPALAFITLQLNNFARHTAESFLNLINAAQKGGGRPAGLPHKATRSPR